MQKRIFLSIICFTLFGSVNVKGQNYRYSNSVVTQNDYRIEVQNDWATITERGVIIYQGASRNAPKILSDGSTLRIKNGSITLKSRNGSGSRVASSSTFNSGETIQGLGTGKKMVVDQQYLLKTGKIRYRKQKKKDLPFWEQR